MWHRIDEQFVDNTKHNMLNTEAFEGIKSGFGMLDNCSDGFADGQLIVMGARPAMGKTTFACSLVDNVCVKAGKSCVFYTSETSARQVIEHIIKIHGNVKCADKYGEMDFNRITRSSEDVRNVQLLIDDTCVGEPDEFIEKCRQLGKVGVVDLIVIDYLQLFESDSGNLEKTLRRLKELAVELECPVFALSQLSRSVESRKNHMPQISDLPQAEIIEAVADEILLLYRDSYYDWDADPKHAIITIARHKKCPRRNVPVFYDPDIPAFRSDPYFFNS